jgi:hypothetical protein
VTDTIQGSGDGFVNSCGNNLVRTIKIGTTVMNRMFVLPPNSFVEIPTPNVMILGGRPLGGNLDYGSQSLKNGFVFL